MGKPEMVRVGFQTQTVDSWPFAESTVGARPRYWGVSSREQHGPIPLMTHMLLGEGGLNWCRTPEGMINGRLMG